MIALATLLLLGSTWFAWHQPPRPVAPGSTPGFFSSPFWHPIEHNTFKRKLIIDTDLRAIAIVDQKIWIVGKGRLILHSNNGGNTWQQQSNHTDAELRSITFHSDGWRGWTVGGGGTILSTADGGSTWQQQNSLTDAWLSSITFHSDGLRGWAVGDGGTILSTADGGSTWQQQNSLTDAWLSSITFHGDGLRGWAVGDNGTILATSDGGNTWQQQSSPTDATLLSITFHSDGQRGWAVGWGSTILSTADGGNTWQQQNNPTNNTLSSITFHSDGWRGWAVGGGGTILSTADGGSTWQQQNILMVEWLNSITFHSDGQRGWAVGSDGTILSTADAGNTWQLQNSPTDAWLNSITFHSDGWRGWAVGSGGTILSTADGGSTWQQQNSPTDVSLTSITFHSDRQRGWAMGSGGTILATSDGGKNWQSVEYRFYPALWFYLALLIALLICAFAFWLRAWQRQAMQRPTAAGQVISDNPVGPGARDLLGARLMTDSLVRFLTNENSLPPLTVAITGGWGSGKSSVMNYLYASLKRKGLKPVWFNAWHHRDEPSVLASLLVNIQQQVIGPWWYPGGFWFRLRLFWRRHWLSKILLLTVAGSLAFTLSWLFSPDPNGTDNAVSRGHKVWHYGLYLARVEQPVILGERGFHQLCGNWAAQHDVSKPAVDVPKPVVNTISPETIFPAAHLPTQVTNTESLQTSSQTHQAATITGANIHRAKIYSAMPNAPYCTNFTITSGYGATNWIADPRYPLLAI